MTPQGTAPKPLVVWSAANRALTETFRQKPSEFTLRLQHSMPQGTRRSIAVNRATAVLMTFPGICQDT